MVVDTDIRSAIIGSGFPIAYEIAELARASGWTVLQNVRYSVPLVSDRQQVDLLLYKLVRGRRVELRAAVLDTPHAHAFYMEGRHTVPIAWDLKFAPVSADIPTRDSLASAFQNLPCYSATREAFTYRKVGQSGSEPATELLGAQDSVVGSLHHQIYPGLLYDRRGRLYMFGIFVRGKMFEVTYKSRPGVPEIEETNYVNLLAEHDPPADYANRAITNADGKPVLLSEALYWFGNRLRIDIVRGTNVDHYLGQLEQAVTNMSEDQIALLGSPWIGETAPKAEIEPPGLTPLEAVDGEYFVPRHRG